MASSYAPSEATSTRASTIHTPPVDFATLDRLHLTDDRFGAIPWPENTYAILDKASGRALTVFEGQLRLMGQRGDNFEAGSLWLCVEAKGYFGFFNEQTGGYLGHDGCLQIHASAQRFNSNQRFIPRRHFNGGYQLLTPSSDSQDQVAIAVCGEKLVTRQHGGTCWEFVKISESK
ncbi:hypothetical protein ACHAQJ_004540 [Trichoderma viride]